MATVARLKSDAKRSEIIKMRFEGHTLEQCGAKLGLTLQGVKYHEDAWLAEQKPSVEVTESRRQLQLASIDSVRAKLFAALEAEVDLSARLAVVDRLDKLWSREARLLGLDMQQGSTVIAITAETLASWLGWDEQSTIDVEAKEIEAPDGAE